MRLFIRIQNGQPFEHPIFENNFKVAFPEIDVDNLPEGFAEFKRVAPPQLGPYEKNQSVEYQLDENGFWTDVFSCEQMTEQERIEKQNEIKSYGAEFDSWVFDEELCDFVAPTPKPDDGKLYFWDEANLTWSEVPDA